MKRRLVLIALSVVALSLIGPGAALAQTGEACPHDPMVAALRACVQHASTQGFIFQDFNLLSAPTTLNNMALGAELAGAKRGAARQQATSVLTELGLGERLPFLPEQLSGGEKQRSQLSAPWSTTRR